MFKSLLSLPGKPAEWLVALLTAARDGRLGPDVQRYYQAAEGYKTATGVAVGTAASLSTYLCGLGLSWSQYACTAETWLWTLTGVLTAVGLADRMVSKTITSAKTPPPRTAPLPTLLKATTIETQEESLRIGEIVNVEGTTYRITKLLQASPGHVLWRAEPL